MADAAGVTVEVVSRRAEDCPSVDLASHALATLREHTMTVHFVLTSSSPSARPSIVHAIRDVAVDEGWGFVSAGSGVVHLTDPVGVPRFFLVATDTVAEVSSPTSWNADGTARTTLSRTPCTLDTRLDVLRAVLRAS